MPKTQFKIPTSMCPSCRYHMETSKVQATTVCPVHFMSLRSVTEDDCITVTVMGEDELDKHEIDESKNGEERRLRKLHPSEKEEYRAQIRADIEKFSKIAHSKKEI